MTFKAAVAGVSPVHTLSAERRALAVAAAGHILLFGWLSVSWSTPKDASPVVEATPVEIIELSELPQAIAPPKPSMRAAPQETVEAAAPEPAPVELALSDPAPMPVPTPELLDVAVPDLAAPAAPKNEAPRAEFKKSAPAPAAKQEPALKSNEQPKPAERPTSTDQPKRSTPQEASVEAAKSRATPAEPAAAKMRATAQLASSSPPHAPAAVGPAQPSRAAAPAKQADEQAVKASKQAARRLDAQELSNLIDKSVPKAPRKPLDVSDLADTIESATPRVAKLDARATATLAQAIQAQIYPCWNPPQGGAAQGRATALLHVEFGRDGSVKGSPRIMSTTGSDSGHARLLAESARRAVMRCAPLKLPDDLYDAWSEVELNFDPEQLG